MSMNANKISSAYQNKAGTNLTDGDHFLENISLLDEEGAKVKTYDPYQRSLFDRGLDTECFKRYVAPCLRCFCYPCCYLYTRECCQSCCVSCYNTCAEPCEPERGSCLRGIWEFFCCLCIYAKCCNAFWTCKGCGCD